MMQPGQQQDGMVAPQPSSMATQPPIYQQHYNQQSQQQQQLMMEQQQQQQQQQQQIWSQQLPEQQYQQQQSQQQQSPPNFDEVRTIWIGNLQHWMDENYISSCFAHTGELVNSKIIRNKQTSQSKCYGFIEFSSHAAAERILQTYNNTLMPHVEQNYRLSWASASYEIFVGGLASKVTSNTLQKTFKDRYSSVKVALVMRDKLTGKNKGYGFVHFRDENEKIRAMSEMNGAMCLGRAMRIAEAVSKKSVGGAASYQNTQEILNHSDPNNTTIFVGNLDSDVTKEDLEQEFRLYGEVVLVKILVNKNCGFVKFTNRSSTEEALKALNGVQLGRKNLRLSWGRNNRQSRPNLTQGDNAAYYEYPQGYNSYGDVCALQDPNMYYGGYLGYASYQNTQEILNHSDPNNTTIFVGNLDSDVTEEDLEQEFRLYGELVLVKILVNKNCGFVKFTNRSSAEEALMALNGVQLGGGNLRLSWGHGGNNRQSRPNLNQWDNAAYHGYPQGYNSYGDVSALQDPNMYYDDYLGYGGDAMS
ncbi:unnamed protein product [Amaranthus hypochondriacus]